MRTGKKNFEKIVKDMGQGFRGAKNCKKYHNFHRFKKILMTIFFEKVKRQFCSLMFEYVNEQKKFENFYL